MRTLLPAGDIGAAYAVQAAWVAAQVAAGDSVAGRKIGLTNPAVQAQLGVDQPDFGTLLATMDCPPGSPIDTGRLLQPRIEAEIAFVLARDLDAPDISPDDVLAATDSVVAALEIVDSRVAGWDISIVDTVADNASSGLFTLGPERRPPGGLDLAACPMSAVARRRGGVRRIGRGLPRPPGRRGRLARRHRPVVRPAAAGRRDRAVRRARPDGPGRAGDRFTADIGGLGQVTAVFAGRHRPVIGAAVIGSGNIGTDLMIKLLRSAGPLRVSAMAGIDPASDGLARAARLGVATTADGVKGLVALPGFDEIARGLRRDLRDGARGQRGGTGAVRHPGHRPDPGRARAVRRARRQPRHAPARA